MVPILIKGTRVSFTWADRAGVGEVISDADEKGRVLVACDPMPPEARHFVILCTMTWLTEIK